MAWVPLPQDRRCREVTKLAWSPIARMAMVKMEHFLSDSWACTGLCRDALKPLPGRHERTCALHCASRSFRTETQPWHAGSLPSQKTWLADLLSGFSARNKLLEKYSSTLGILSQRMYLLSVVRVKQDGGTCSPASQEAEVGKPLEFTSSRSTYATKQDLISNKKRIVSQSCVSYLSTMALK